MIGYLFEGCFRFRIRVLVDFLAMTSRRTSMCGRYMLLLPLRLSFWKNWIFGKIQIMIRTCFSRTRHACTTVRHDDHPPPPNQMCGPPLRFEFYTAIPSAFGSSVSRRSSVKWETCFPFLRGFFCHGQSAWCPPGVSVIHNSVQELTEPPPERGGSYTKNRRPPEGGGRRSTT